MRKSYIAAISLFLLVYIVPLGVRPLFYQDETRYAEIPREMLASGDWLVPRIDGLRYFAKPVLGYWLNALSMTLFGSNSFALRFPSAMGVGISALIIFLLAQRFAGGYVTGIVAAAALLTCPEVFVVGTTNILDSVFSMLVTLAMGSFFFAYRENISWIRMCLLVSCGIFIGLACLTKGFIAFVIPVIAIAPFMIWEGEWKKLFSFSWVPFITAILVSLPWFVMICLREHDFWNYFFWVEHVSRFISPTDNPHPRPFWFFFPLIAGGALPWSVLVPALLPRLSRLIRKDLFIRFALCWFLFPFLFFSASHCKLATYILPCYPPLVILITVSLMNYFETNQHKVFNTVALCFSALIGTTTAVLIVNQLTGWPGLSRYGPEETWKWTLTACSLMVWSLLLLLVTKMPDYRRKIILFCVAPLVCMFSSHFILPDELILMKAPGAFLLRHSEKVTPETILVADKRLVSSVCWFYKRNDVLLIDKGGEVEYGLGFEDAQDRQLTIDSFRELYDKEAGKKRIVLIISKKLYTKHELLFPQAAFKDVSATMVFLQFQKQISS